MSKLRLHVPERMKSDGFNMDQVPAHLLEEISNVDVLFNHSILLAEQFQQHVADALDSVNRVYHSAGSDAVFFVKEDFEDLNTIFEHNKNMSQKLIDKKGAYIDNVEPLSEEYFEIDHQGRVCFKSHNFPLIYFLEDIDKIRQLFEYALEHDLFVAYQAD